MDLIVQATLGLEIKAVHQMHPIHQAQLRTYLRLSGLPLGLPLNFNAVQMKDGIARVIGASAVMPRASRQAGYRQIAAGRECGEHQRP